MIENYGGGLTGHRNGGTWSTGVGNDGRLRNGIPFEPLCNCPGFGSNWQTVTDCGAGETILFSEMWEGAITAVSLRSIEFHVSSNEMKLGTLYAVHISESQIDL